MNIPFPLPITKMSGAGNDFIIIDHRSLFIPESIHRQFAKAVCRRRFSAGADGLILIEHSEHHDFCWKFYNSDGSVGEMCGNGARCAARYAYRHGLVDRKMRFATGAGTIEAEIIGEPEAVRIKMTEPHSYQKAEPIQLGTKRYEIFSINTGVPHAVLFYKATSAAAEDWGRQIRHDKQFLPAGTNVNFVWIDNTGDLHVTTYERGVEEVTMACGTGVVASVLTAARHGLTASPATAITAGNEQLIVSFQQDGERFSNIYLQGEARFIYDGTLQQEALL
ncbi:MAG: diaminopimelate epimerase [Desulfobacterales bacterium]|nr:MAG: diaminopimelate epimerase [Desulfobacterales bacterium]